MMNSLSRLVGNEFNNHHGKQEGRSMKIPIVICK